MVQHRKLCTRPHRTRTPSKRSAKMTPDTARRGFHTAGAAAIARLGPQIYPVICLQPFDPGAPGHQRIQTLRTPWIPCPRRHQRGVKQQTHGLYQHPCGPYPANLQTMHRLLQARHKQSQSSLVPWVAEFPHLKNSEVRRMLLQVASLHRQRDSNLAASVHVCK